MSIIVKNSAKTDISAAINHWGSDGKTSFFQINNGEHEEWDRSDDRGFVMSLKINGTQLPYYVQHNSNIEVFGVKNVKDNGVQIMPLNN